MGARGDHRLRDTYADMSEVALGHISRRGVRYLIGQLLKGTGTNLHRLARPRCTPDLGAVQCASNMPRAYRAQFAGVAGEEEG